MSNSVGLSTVSELIKQTSLINNQQYIAAKDGLQFAETAIKTTRSRYECQQNKLSNSFRSGALSEEEYENQTKRLKNQFEIDLAPWKIYVEKLTKLIQQYPSESEPQRNNKRTLNQSLPTKRSRITFSSSSSESDTSEPITPVIQKVSSPVIIRYDSSTNTDPLELSLRSPFPSAPNTISFTAHTKQVTQQISLQHINEIAAKHIVTLHDEGQLVRWNDVIWRLLAYFHVQDLGNIGIQRADHIPCVDNLIRTQNKINTYLDAYAYWQTIGTLKELENDLARIFYKNDFNELLIGPIEKQPKIEDLFRLRQARNEPVKKDLRCSDVLKYLDEYMTKESSWKTESEISVEKFFQFIAKQLGLKNIYQLGIRMKSAYLARNCIKALQANQRKTMEIARTELNEILNFFVQKEITRVSKIIRDKLDDSKDNTQQRQNYASMDPIDILNDLTEICRQLCPDYSSFRKISHALDIVSKDVMLRKIFQIAICHGNLETFGDKVDPKNLLNSENSKKGTKIYFHSSDSSDDEFDVKNNESSNSKIQHLADAELLQALKEQIGSLKMITFSLLSRIEQRICDKFKVTNFHELGHGTFSAYMSQNEHLLFSVDTEFKLSSSNSHENNNKRTTMISLEDLEHLILPLLNRSTDLQYIEQIICYHYRIESFEQLGHGSLRSILNSLKQKKERKTKSVFYECLLVDDIAVFKQTLSCTHSDAEQQALNAINQCPPLANINYVTQWDLHFRPMLGNLKSFLCRHKFSVMELNYDTLLKLHSNSSLDQFKESLYNYDVLLTSGHLVSILVQDGSLQNAPLSLLSNVVHTFLLTNPLDNRLYYFLLQIFARIPFLILSSVIERIFLQPLVKIEGSQMKVRETFWKILNKQDFDILTRFIHLGQRLGFVEWSMNNQTIESTIEIQQEKTLPIPVTTISTTPLIPTVEQTFSFNSPYEFIEYIRREKFGIGLNLSNESQHLTDHLKSLVGRSLERLSKELYNTDMHFVLELIQNADDNQYADKPSLVFVIDANSINIYNNELGFQEQNIQALCDIGKSTKGKHKKGYIGQKGIGFKSVFTVSDRPEIYSNGYRIYFDALNGPIGYILPNWIENECKDEEYANWSTRICLPLKSENEMQKHKSRSLTESFHDIRPSLLLFLNRLRSITIHNRLTNSKQLYERIDLHGTHIVEIHSQQIIEKWFIIKKQIIIPEEIKTNIDDAVEATEIAIAFPLHDFSNKREIQLTKQDVYAYLPLRTFGFTFIIQADFEVPSSRQDILSDSMWNQYLLNEIPSVFLSSLDTFHQQEASLPIDPLRLFLHFLPNETSIYSNNLFTPVCRNILHLLRSRRFLPVVNDTNLHMPSECVLINDLTIKEILTPELLYNHLNLYYLKDDLYEHEKQLYELGVHRLGHRELIDVIKHMFTSEITFENTKLLSKWFCCLYRCLNELSLSDEQNVLKHIRSLKIFPLKNHLEFVTLNQIHQTIFFPSKNIQLPKLIENDLTIINEELWMNLEENSMEINQIQLLLERLGIQCLTHRAICEQHIYPVFENENLWSNKQTATLIAYVTYIFDLWSKQNHYIDMSRLKSIVRLHTNHDLKKPIDHPIYFTPRFGTQYDLLNDFDSYDWTLLSNEYIGENSSVNYLKRLHQFLSELGVLDFLYPIHRWTYDQFRALIQIQSIPLNKKLFVALQESYSTFHDNEQFLIELKGSMWVPTIQIYYSLNEQNNRIEFNKVRKLDRPTNVYIRTKQIEKLFAHHIQYIDIEIDRNSSFSNDIGLIEHVTLNDVSSMLLNWCKNSQFFSSISHLQTIYEYIYKYMSMNELRDFINNNPIFYIPTSSSDWTTITYGKFVNISEVCWSDPTDLFNKYSSKIINRHLLEPYYADQKTIFLDTFSIPLYPTIEEYINLLAYISSIETTDDTIHDAFLIFKTIGKWCEQSQHDLDNLNIQNKLRHQPMFPTKDHRWVSLDDHPLISDNTDIVQEFTHTSHIPLIDVPSSEALSFFNWCGIKSFSSSITIEPIIANPSNGMLVQNLIGPLVPYVQLYMKSRPEFADAYQWTKSTNMSSQLAHVQFHMVDSLQLIYRFKFDSSVCVIREEKTYYDKSEMIFYVHKDWMEQTKFYRDIFHSFARLFLPYPNDELIRSLGNFMNLLHNEEENNLETFAKYQSFDLNFKDADDIPWHMSSTSKPMKHVQSKIDEKKVQMLLENVAQNQEQLNAYKRKKRNELRTNLSETSMITSNSLAEYRIVSEPSANLFPRFDPIRCVLDTPYENIESHAKDVNIEDLTHQVLDNRDSTIGSDQESLEKIGRWGEQWVNEYLHSKYHDRIQCNEIEIIWLNEILEQGKPYDFVLKDLKSKSVTYIEVKSTLSHNRQLIPITYNELQYCCSLSDVNQDFQIYRVYNTGQLRKVKLRIVEHVEEKLRKHDLELFLLI